VDRWLAKTLSVISTLDLVNVFLYNCVEKGKNP
jgi:hypothetical protein